MWADILRLVSAYPALATLVTSLVTAVVSVGGTHWLTVRRTRRVDEREHLLAALKAKDEEIKSLRAKHELDVQLQDKGAFARALGQLASARTSQPAPVSGAVRPKTPFTVRGLVEVLKVIREEFASLRTFDAKRLIEEEPLAGFVVTFPGLLVSELCRRFSAIGEDVFKSGDAKEVRAFLWEYETHMVIASSMGMDVLRAHVANREQPLDEIFAARLQRARLGAVGQFEPILSVEDIAPDATARSGSSTD